MRSLILYCSDRIDLINSIADLKLDNKRLQEMNRALQVQMEGSEEHLREIQTENQQLKQDIKEYVVCSLTKWFIPNLHMMWSLYSSSSSLSLSLSPSLSPFLSPPCRSLPPIVPSFQANLNHLEQVEGENTELAALVEEGKRQCQQLTSSIEKQEKEVG